MGEMENTQDPSEATPRVIIFHPGSRNLRFGFDTDCSPKRMSHCIARKRKCKEKKRYSDLLKSDSGSSGSSTAAAAEKTLYSMEESLRTYVSADGVTRHSVDKKRLTELNAVNVTRRERTEHEEEEEDEVVIGDKVWSITEDDKYDIHFPLKGGDLNIHEGVGGSLTAVFADLEAIWRCAVTNELGVSTEDLGSYRAMIILPTLGIRNHIKHYVTMLLIKMGFEACFVLQDHVAATFGAGLGFACVIDIGHEKTSVSCVEDGISIPQSRIELGYGSGDLEAVFRYLLRKIGAPVDLINRHDSTEFKESVFHLDLERSGTEYYQMQGTGMRIYFADETLLAPAALFYTGLLSVVGQKKMKVYTAARSDPEDPHDQNYLAETSRKYTKAGDNELNAEGHDSTLHETDEPNEKRRRKQYEKNILPLDQAIQHSISSCPSDESITNRKMWSSILLVGGGARIDCLERYLQNRLVFQIPDSYRADPREIVANAKGLPADCTVWKGGSVFCSLESAPDCLIFRTEWERFGQKVLRERAPFPWT